jgi:hypothetical protein
MTERAEPQINVSRVALEAAAGAGVGVFLGGVFSSLHRVMTVGSSRGLLYYAPQLTFGAAVGAGYVCIKVALEYRAALEGIAVDREKPLIHVPPMALAGALAGGVIGGGIKQAGKGALGCGLLGVAAGLFQQSAMWGAFKRSEVEYARRRLDAGHEVRFSPHNPMPKPGIGGVPGDFVRRELPEILDHPGPSGDGIRRLDREEPEHVAQDRAALRANHEEFERRLLEQQPGKEGGSWGSRWIRGWMPIRVVSKDEEQEMVKRGVERTRLFGKKEGDRSD